MVALPSPCLIVLVGPSASGKTAWALASVPPHQVVSSDALRGVVGEGEDDLEASTDAFAVLDLVIERRLARRLTTVVDTLGLDLGRRRQWRDLARAHGMPAVAVTFATPAAECRARNRARPRPVPAAVLTAQLRAFALAQQMVADEGFDLVIEPEPVRLVRAPFLVPAVAEDPSLSPSLPGGLRFGLQIPKLTGPGGPGAIADRLRTIAVAAEEAGFQSLWVMDHFRQIPFLGPPWHDMLESYTTLAWLAAVTSRIRLGTLVTGITYRNVAHLGKIVATLDVLSGGRALCGLGLAWYAEEHRAYGWPFPPVSERYALLEDALELLPKLWGPGSPSFEGRVLSVPEAMCYPRPLQEHIPILVGGSGERRTLQVVARAADACNLFGGPDEVRHKVSVLHGHCAAVGRDPAAVEVTQLATVLVGSDDDEVARLVDRLRPPRTNASRYATRVNAGTVDDHIGRFRALADAGVQTAIVSFPDLGDTAPIERFARIIDTFRSES